MDIKNCRKCGKIYAYDGHKTCPICRKSDEDEFTKVKEYIYDNPGATIQEVSEATDVSTKKIIKYLREGRLEIKGENHNLVLDCERCGTAIKSGRFCGKCTNELERELKGPRRVRENRDRTSSSEKDKMFIADRHRK